MENALDIVKKAIFKEIIKLTLLKKKDFLDWIIKFT